MKLCFNHPDKPFEVVGSRSAYCNGQPVTIEFCWDRYVGESPRLAFTEEVLDVISEISENTINIALGRGETQGFLAHEDTQGNSSYLIAGYWSVAPLIDRPADPPDLLTPSKVYSSQTVALVEAAKAFMKQKQEEGWTKADFAAALKEMLESDDP